MKAKRYRLIAAGSIICIALCVIGCFWLNSRYNKKAGGPSAMNGAAVKEGVQKEPGDEEIIPADDDAIGFGQETPMAQHQESPVSDSGNNGDTKSSSENSGDIKSPGENSTNTGKNGNTETSGGSGNGESENQGEKEPEKGTEEPPQEAEKPNFGVSVDTEKGFGAAVDGF